MFQMDGNDCHKLAMMPITNGSQKITPQHLGEHVKQSRPDVRKIFHC